MKKIFNQLTLFNIKNFVVSKIVCKFALSK